MDYFKDAKLIGSTYNDNEICTWKNSSQLISVNTVMKETIYSIKKPDSNYFIDFQLCGNMEVINSYGSMAICVGNLNLVIAMPNQLSAESG
jgi:hypothetical protein